MFSSPLSLTRASPPCSRQCSVRASTKNPCLRLESQKKTRPTRSEKSNIDRRRALAAPAVLLSLLALPGDADAALAEKKNVDKALNDAFNKALRAETLEEADAAWTEAIELAPDNSACWSNRGTIRLQQGRWAPARDDLQKALSLEVADESYVNAIILVNLGNTQGALGDWGSAMQNFDKASRDSNVGEIARANHSLALFQIGETEKAISEARGLIRKDPGFLDMRCALTAYLWASGAEAEAEAEFQALQEADNGVGGDLYGKSMALDRVRGRWPPKPTAALDAYLRLKRSGSALDYDGSTIKVDF
ncbi:hypothetical protein BSKO_08728 [Bryopsis sp. KO-2023]|nr:hypothetical protein BSKO_08728 [Bryopsis sp. KO-2023]